jgi:hypothetical protein
MIRRTNLEKLIDVLGLAHPLTYSPSYSNSALRFLGHCDLVFGPLLGKHDSLPPFYKKP